MTYGLIGIFAGYTIASYGICLLRGYDVTWKQWINPLNPYSWPKGKVPHVPATQVFPSAATA